MREFTKPQEVREELNIVEQSLDSASSTDEYFEALLKSNNILVELMRKQVVGADGYTTVPPDNTAGIVVYDVNAGDNVDFLYKDNGRTLIANVDANTELEASEVAKYDGDQEGLIPVSDVRQGDLDFGSMASALHEPNEFIFTDTTTQTDSGKVEVEPGEEKVILETETPSQVGLREIGTNDVTYTMYQYEIDGEDMLTNPILKPLGLYNDRYEFPEPVRVKSKLKVKVMREEDASAPEEYFSNAVLM